MDRVQEKCKKDLSQEKLRSPFLQPTRDLSRVMGLWKTDSDRRELDIKKCRSRCVSENRLPTATGTSLKHKNQPRCDLRMGKASGTSKHTGPNFNRKDFCVLSITA